MDRLMDIRRGILLLLLGVLSSQSEALLPRSKLQRSTHHQPRPRPPFLPNVLSRTRRRASLYPLSALVNNAEDSSSSRDRRRFLTTIPFTLLTPYVAHARGLVQFPCTGPLQNTYHFMRVGTSLLEEDDIWSTNPLFLTNREDALSPAGQEQVVQACEKLRGKYYPTTVRYSFAASCVETADIVGRELRLGRDRLVPEFFFLDPRAIGRWDMLSKAETEPAVWAMDFDEAGPDGLGARPPPNEDGTPHEVLADQAVRLRQLFSALESSFSGDTILLIFPDGTGPALLSAMIAGIPYNRAHELEFAPGELRVDITLESTQALWKTKQNDPEYQKVLAKGRENLQKLKARTDFVNIKDQKLEQERLVMEKQLREKAENRRMVEEQAAEKRLERQREAANDGIPPVVLGALGVAAAGGAVVLGGSSGSDEESIANATETSTSSLPESTANVTAAIELPDKVDLGAISAKSLTEKINDDMSSTFTVSDDGKYQAAEQAMQDYLDKDDGGEAWLQSIGEIITEDSDDEAFQTNELDDEAFQ